MQIRTGYRVNLLLTRRQQQFQLNFTKRIGRVLKTFRSRTLYFLSSRLALEIACIKDDWKDACDENTSHPTK